MVAAREGALGFALVSARVEGIRKRVRAALVVDWLRKGRKDEARLV